MTYRNHIFCTILFLGLFQGFAQKRYLDDVFTHIQKETYTYSDTLKLDFYTAKSDTVSSRPLLLLVHGGGFSGGTRDNVMESTFCTTMAKKGYAVASISYRLTRKGKSFGCDCPAKEKMESFIKVTEDILKASQFMADRSKDLKFNNDKIVLIGSSAGAEGILNTAFLPNHRNFRPLPYQELKFAGLISFSGALVDVRYITEDNAVPSLLFHGKKDNLVPYGSASHHFCNENDLGYLPLDGSQSIAKKLKQLDKPYTLVIDPEGNHDWANLAYSRTDIIAQFIKTTIIDGDWQQSILKVSPKK